MEWVNINEEICFIFLIFRLLKSLEEADYDFEKNNPNWNIVLEIRIDVGSGKKVSFEEKNNKILKCFRESKFKTLLKSLSSATESQIFTLKRSQGLYFDIV